jgi:high-affinity iron transporter
VIFLKAVSFAGEGSHILGAGVGILIGILMGYALFKTSLRINLGTFFRVTNVLLILIAAGLVAHGIHELQEVKLLPVYVEHVWDINPALLEGGSPPLLHENGAIGSVLKGVFGYNGNPTLLEVLSYVGYLLVAAGVWRYINVRKSRSNTRASSRKKQAASA